MEFEFLTPLSNELVDFTKSLNPQQLGRKILLHTETEFPDISGVKIAIIGVLEDRGNQNINTKTDLNSIRKEFYSLFLGNWVNLTIDLGNILQGNTIFDSYFVTKRIVAQLIKKNIVPIVIGGSQDLTYALYRAYDYLEQMVNMVVIDKKFDFGKENEPISSDSFLTKIIIETPNNLFNYCNIGFQTYYNSQEEIDLVENLFFDKYRLGEVTNNIEITEPVFRDADLVSIDLTSIKSSDSGNFETFSPNGFDGKEICALARYAGISDKTSLLGIFNHNNSHQEAVLISQIIWYFIEGYHYRSNEYPFGTKENYLKYIVPLEEEELIFYKSNKTSRWWVEVPFIINKGNKLKKNTLLPCSYQEYLAACNQEIPERWWKAQRKSMY